MVKLFCDKCEREMKDKTPRIRVSLAAIVEGCQEDGSFIICENCNLELMRMFPEWEQKYMAREKITKGRQDT